MIHAYNKLCPYITFLSLKNDSLMDQAWMLCRYLPTKLASTSPVPSWSAMHARLSEPSVKTEIGYLPLWDSEPKDLTTIYSIMKAIQAITHHLGQENTIITFDQAIYKLAKEIQWKNPVEFSDTVIRMGGFHILLNFMGTIGKMMDGSGIIEWLTESGLYSEATSISIMKGKQYNRGVRAHKLLREALGICEWDKFASNLGETADEMLPVLISATEKVSTLCDEGKEVKEEVQSVINLVKDIQPQYEEFRSKVKEKSALAQYWMRYMDAVDLMLTFIKAEHSQDWNLHINCVKEMSKVFTHLIDKTTLDGSPYILWIW